MKVAGTCAGAVTEDGTSQVAHITQTLTLAGGYTTTNWLTPNVASNVTVLDAQGAGRVLSVTAPVTVSGLTVTGGNSNEDSGGGAFFASSATATNTTFAQNTSGFRGGGGAEFWGPTTVTNSTFTLNTAIRNGGGVYFFAPNQSRLTNVLIAGNSAGNGQAIYVFDPTLLELIHTTIVSPTLVTGPAVYVNSGTVAITNTLVASHTVGLENVSGSVSENFNLFSNVTAPYSGTIISGGNSITDTATFANHTDYKLSAASAAIDKGTNAGVNRDFFGTARPQGFGFEIGYAEFVPTSFKLYLPIIGR